MNFKQIPLMKKSKRYIATLIILIILFAVWYYVPRTYKENITFETEDKEVLTIDFELSAQKSFFKPDEFTGKIYVNGKEYASLYPDETFLAENKKESLNPILNSSVDWYPVFFSHIYNRDNLLDGLRSKFTDEKWFPYFVSADQKELENTIFVSDLQKLFSEKNLKAGEINLFIWKDGKIFEASNIIK